MSSTIKVIVDYGNMNNNIYEFQDSMTIQEMVKRISPQSNGTTTTVEYLDDKTGSLVKKEKENKYTYMYNTFRLDSEKFMLKTLKDVFKNKKNVKIRGINQGDIIGGIK